MNQVASISPKAQVGRPSRWALARQSFVSFAAVLACYWLYWFIAVPMIEPSVDEQLAEETSEERIQAARDTVTVRQREVAQYFGPDDWESNNPSIWQNGQLRLLFGKLEPQTDGTVELNPCTLMFFEKPDSQGAGRPIIMRAPEGAVVEFDQRIVLRTVDLNSRRLVGGVLRGEIRIYQRESAPGAGDDLEITTRGIKLTSNRIWTPEPVQFRRGKSHGSGRDLEIKLASTEPNAPSGSMRGMTVQSLELKREVRMRLEMTSVSQSDSAQVPGRTARTGQSPIEITCQGSFIFDMQDYAASFHQNVDVFVLNESGESDQLNCQLLTVFFARPGEKPPSGSESSSSGTTRSPTSQVRAIEARGSPVTMRSPAQGMYARCNGVDYLPGAAGEPGTLVAFGPGVIHGHLPNDPAGNYNAAWSRELRFEPEGPLYRAALQGATKIEIAGMGEITADEVFAWLSKKPTPAPARVTARSRVQPVTHQKPGAGPPGSDVWQIERVVARRYQAAEAGRSQDPVRIKSPQLDAVTNLLEAVVVREPSRGPAVNPAGPAGNANTPQRNGRTNPQHPTEKFDVTAQAVQIQLVPRGEELTVASATIDADAVLSQWKLLGQTKTRQMLVKGDRLHVSDAHTDATRVSISGQPGFVEAQGMTLTGAVIELEKKSNRMWINGPGRLVLPVTQDMNGKLLPRPQTLTVDWKKSMDFQSATAVFTGTVVARSSQQVVNTEVLEATLSRPVDFANPNMGTTTTGERLDLASIRTRGWTMLEGRQLDEQGQQTSFSQMGVSDLSVDRVSGAIAGTGPGWVKYVALGAPQSVDLPGQRQSPVAPPEPDDKSKLTYLFVNFRTGLEGNLNARNVRFFDQTKTIYGPVADWNDTLDDKDLSRLGNTGMSLAADSLAVREMPGPPGTKRGFFELDASGSILAEGQRFTAQGEKMTYAERNDQLTLHGGPAELFMEGQNGGSRSEYRAKLVQYWFKEHRFASNGADLLSIPLQNGTPPKRATARPPAASPASAPTSSTLPSASSVLPPR